MLLTQRASLEVEGRIAFLVLVAGTSPQRDILYSSSTPGGTAKGEHLGHDLLSGIPAGY